MSNIAKIFVYIELSSSSLPKEKIGELWNNCDMYFSMSGESFFEFEKGKKVEKKRQNDYCNIRFEFSQTESTLNDILINFLIEQKDVINYITNKYADIIKRIHICIYPSSEQYTFSFSVEFLKLCVALNLEIGATVIQL